MQVKTSSSLRVEEGAALAQMAVGRPSSEQFVGQAAPHYEIPTFLKIQPQLRHANRAAVPPTTLNHSPR
jgi:hypothetical protein